MKCLLILSFLVLYTVAAEQRTSTSSRKSIGHGVSRRTRGVQSAYSSLLAYERMYKAAKRDLAKSVDHAQDPETVTDLFESIIHLDAQRTEIYRSFLKLAKRARKSHPMRKSLWGLAKAVGDEAIHTISGLKPEKEQVVVPQYNMVPPYGYPPAPAPGTNWYGPGTNWYGPRPAPVPGPVPNMYSSNVSIN